MRIIMIMIIASLSNFAIMAAPIDLFKKAAEKGDFGIMRKMIIDGKIKVGEKDKQENTALHYSVGDPAAIKLLLEAGADANKANKEGELALHHAAFFGLVETMQLLIDAKANIDQQAKDGTPLHYAVYKGKQIDAVKLLLKNNATPNATDTKGYTALHWAAYNGYQDIAKELLTKKADPNMKILDLESTPLHLSAAKGNTELTKLLLAQKADPNLLNKDGHSPLFIAIDKKNFVDAEAMLAKKADPNITDKAGNALIHYASFRGDLDVLELLIKKGKADVNLAGEKGLTPLFIALFQKKQEVAKFLIENKVRLNDKNPNGDTALVLVCSQGNLDLAKLLIAKKADVNLISDQGHSPLAVARYFKHQEIIDLLVQNKAKD